MVQLFIWDFVLQGKIETSMLTANNPLCSKHRCTYYPVQSSSSGISAPYKYYNWLPRDGIQDVRGTMGLIPNGKAPTDFSSAGSGSLLLLQSFKPETPSGVIPQNQTHKVWTMMVLI